MLQSCEKPAYTEDQKRQSAIIFQRILSPSGFLSPGALFCLAAISFFILYFPSFLHRARSLVSAGVMFHSLFSQKLSVWRCVFLPFLKSLSHLLEVIVSLLLFPSSFVRFITWILRLDVLLCFFEYVQYTRIYAKIKFPFSSPPCPEYSHIYPGTRERTKEERIFVQFFYERYTCPTKTACEK